MPVEVRAMDVDEPWRLRLEVRLWVGLTAVASLEGELFGWRLVRSHRPGVVLGRGGGVPNLARPLGGRFAAVLVELG